MHTAEMLGVREQREVLANLLWLGIAIQLRPEATHILLGLLDLYGSTLLPVVLERANPPSGHPPPNRISLDMAAHHSMGTDDPVILNSRTAQNGGTPSNENVVANGNRLFVNQNLPSLTLYNRPTEVMSQDGDRSGEINVIPDGQKVWIGHVNMRFSRTMERDVLPDRNAARTQVLQISLVAHEELVVNLPHHVF